MVAGIPLNGLRLPIMDEITKKPVDGKLVKTKQEAQNFVETIMAPNHSPDMQVFREDQGSICRDGINSLPPPDDYGFRIYHQAALLHRSRTEAMYANITFNVTPVQTPTAAPNPQALSQLQCPLIVLHGDIDYFVSVKQVRAITKLTIAEQWAPKGLLSYYEIPSCGHMFMYDNPTAFQTVYLRALEEQVICRRYNNRRHASL